MSLLRNSALNVGGRVAALVLLAVSGLLVARLLGPQGRGEYALLVLTANFAVMALTFGLGTSNVYFISQSRISKETLVGWSLVIGLLPGLAAVLLIWYFDDLLIGLFMRGIAPANLHLIALVIPANLVFNHLIGILQGEQRFVAFNAINLTRPIIFLGTFLALYLGLTSGVRAGVWAYLASFGLGSLLLLPAIGVSLRGGIKLQIGVLRQMFSYGWKVYLAEIFRYLFHRVDLFFVGLFLDTTQAGYYSILALFAEASWLLPVSVGNALLPAAGQASEARMRQVIPAATRLIIFLTAAGILVFLAIDRWFLKLAFGADFLPALPALRLIYPGMLAMSGIKIIGSYVLSRDEAQFNTAVSLAGLVLNAALNWFLIPHYGIAGAAAATSLSFLIMMAAYIGWLKRRLGVPVTETIFVQMQDLRMLWGKIRLAARNQSNAD